MKWKLLTIVTLVAMICGCTTITRSDDFKRQAETAQKEIDVNLAKEKYSKVRVLDRPPQLIEEIIPSTDPTWFEDNTQIVAKDMPLSIVLRQILGAGTQIEYGHAVSPSKSTTLHFEGTKREALNILALQVDYGFSSEEGKVLVEKFQTKTYVLPTTIGDNAHQMGSAGQGGGNASASDAQSGQISTTGGDDGQFANSTSSKYNITKHVFAGIEKILKGEATLTTGSTDEIQLDTSSTTNEEALGYAKEIPGLSSIVVRTSPSMMKLIDVYVEDIVNQLIKAVELEVIVVEVQEDEGVEFGIDAAIEKYVGKGNLTLDLVAPTFADAIDGVGIGWKGDNGSTALLNALRLVGKVSVRTSQKVEASNHMVQEIDLSSVQSYIAKTTTTFNGSDNDIPTTSIETAEVRDGVKLLALPSIQDDRVYLKLNGVLSKLLKFDDQKINGVTIRSPRTRQSRFNISGTYEFNKTIVVTHMRQETNESTDTSYLDAPVGTSGANRVVDTLVLLTPRRVTFSI